MKGWEERVSVFDSVETIRHLRPMQIAYLVRRRFVGRYMGMRMLGTTPSKPNLREELFSKTPFIAYPPAVAFNKPSGEIILLNLSREHNHPINWSPTELPILWQMELNYFHWLSPNSKHENYWCYLTDWVKNCPTNPGAPAWSPYAVAQRVLHWTRLLDGDRKGWQGEDEESTVLMSLYQQSRFLYRNQEFDLLGNHLVKTAVGLLAAGCFFSGLEPEKWRKYAAGILLKQAHEQILRDGGHYERSPMYHLLVLMDYSDALNMYNEDTEWTEEISSRIEEMAKFAGECVDPTGNILLFNDSCYGQAPNPQEVIEYASRVINSKPPKRSGNNVTFREFGLSRLQCHPWVVWVDGGKIGEDFLLAHAHADVSSVLLWHDGNPVFIDTGVYCYGGDPTRRSYDRGGRAHNVVLVDGKSCAKPWKDFRVSRRPRNVEMICDGNKVEIAHDSFRFLPGRPEHTRKVTVEPSGVMVTDHVRTTRGKPLRADIFWHIAPGTEVERRWIDRDKKVVGFNLKVGDSSFNMKIEGVDKALIENGLSAREFYRNEDIPVIHASREAPRDVVINTYLEVTS